jgi:hypothetical protein
VAEPIVHHLCEATSAPGYTVCGYPLQKRVPSTIWRSFGRSAVELAGPIETAKQGHRPAGFWVSRRLFPSPDGGTLLAQWSGPCGAQSYLVSIDTGNVRPVAPRASESRALGWTVSGSARILVPRPVCGVSRLAPGIYAIDPATLRPTLLRRVTGRTR